jgi:L-fucose mutarotase
VLKVPILHPDLLRHAAALGHGSQVLLADGNYPVSTGSPSGVPIVHLNLRPGLVSVMDVLEPLVSLLPIEAAAVMAVESQGPYAMDEDPPVWSSYTAAVPSSVALERLARSQFYEAARAEDVGLVVATADQQLYANLLLTVGVLAAARLAPAHS